jgi:hypothetical protein
MAAIKRCAGCLMVYEENHWAYHRETCPACGGKLSIPAAAISGPAQAHYDSSVDIKFDLSNLLTPEQRREILAIFLIGSVLLVLAFLLRLLFVVLSGKEGFWKVPLWLDGIVVLMLGLGVLMMFWSARKWWLHVRDTRHTR